MNRGGWREGPKKGTKRGKKEYRRLRNEKRAAAREREGEEGEARDQRLDVIPRLTNDQLEKEKRVKELYMKQSDNMSETIANFLNSDLSGGSRGSSNALARHVADELTWEYRRSKKKEARLSPSSQTSNYLCTFSGFSDAPT